MSKIKNSGLDQYGAVPFERQQFGTAGVKGVKYNTLWINNSMTYTINCCSYSVDTSVEVDTVYCIHENVFISASRQMLANHLKSTY